MPAPDADAANTEQRIVELEVKASFHERTLEDLDTVLRSFTLRVEALERELSRLRGDLEGSVAPTGAGLLPLDDENE